MVPRRPLPRRGSLILGVLVLAIVRVLLGVAAWDPPFSALTWDDFTRVLMGQQWAADPILIPDLVWLPLHTWILGGAFSVAGDLFSASPMALAAVVHTLALIVAAGVVGRTGYEISGSRAGGLLAFAALLFSPWGFYLSLSGLGETIYYLAVSVAVFGMVRWTKSRTGQGLALAAGGIAAACALRYEGWWLAAAWATVLLVGEIRSQGLRNLRPGVWLAALVPFLVPAAWMAVNYAKTGSPLFFASESARYFLSAYGALNSIPARLGYYPLSLIRSAPLLVPGLLALVLVNRNSPVVRRIGVVTGLHLALFYCTSLVSSAVGAFNERFMFAFVVALMPVLATVPALVAGVTGAMTRRFVIAALLVLGVMVTAVRITDRPTEWTHSPDLLTLIAELAEAAPPDRPLGLVLDPRLVAIELTPLAIGLGDRLQIATTEGLGVTGPDDLPPGWDLYVTRYPDPALSTAEFPTLMIGRYGVGGPGASLLDIDPMPCSCTEWELRDEAGATRKLPPGPIAWLEFTGQDPAPDSVAILSTKLSPDSARGAVEVRSTYGHGFNPGRIEVEVRVAGQVIESWDLAEPSRWRRISFDIPESASPAVLEVAVVASPNIEPDWGWGRASTVLVRAVETFR